MLKDPASADAHHELLQLIGIKAVGGGVYIIVHVAMRLVMTIDIACGVYCALSSPVKDIPEDGPWPAIGPEAQVLVGPDCSEDMAIRVIAQIDDRLVILVGCPVRFQYSPDWREADGVWWAKGGAN